MESYTQHQFNLLANMLEPARRSGPIVELV